jgi:hypothetical protein
MNAIKAARRYIQLAPADDADAMTLSALVLALESEAPFELGRLYALKLERFELALDILKEWRLDRYYAGKAKLVDLSWQLHAASPAA